MRLIDADALMARLDKLSDLIFEHCRRGLTFADVEEVIDNAPTVMEWVSVEEELPQPGKVVLLAFPKNRGLTEMGYLCDSRKRLCLIVKNSIAEYATHWMPLPEPPKEAKE